ncbi:MAG: sigma-70 family RNA polymerase sigma factor [Opitutaceae bacterium]|nr:sigma-70 family RNA polymerase sigma factor [Opitutaceae bacterium]
MTEMKSGQPEQARWFAEEVQPHEPALRAYLRQRFPDVNDIDDLVQESYVRLLAAQRKGPIASAKAYLFSIARNGAISLLRRPRIFSDQPLSSCEAKSVPEDRRDVADQVSTRQEVAVLMAAVDALPRRCREIMILVKIQGLSHQVVADRLGLSVQTVHVQVMRGIQKCTLFLRQRGVLEDRST